MPKNRRCFRLAGGQSLKFGTWTGLCTIQHNSASAGLKSWLSHSSLDNPQGIGIRMDRRRETTDRTTRSRTLTVVTAYQDIVQCYVVLCTFGHSGPFYTCFDGPSILQARQDQAITKRCELVKQQRNWLSTGRQRPRAPAKDCLTTASNTSGCRFPRPRLHGFADWQTPALGHGRFCCQSQPPSTRLLEPL
jgi:hypothetical protein